MKQCEQCAREFVSYVGRQRFCSRSCGDQWFAAERKEAVQRLRAERGSTYFDHAVAMADAELGGRFASTAQVHVTGAAPGAPVVAPEWSRDQAALLPDEPPTGYAIDDLPPEGQ